MFYGFPETAIQNHENNKLNGVQENIEPISSPNFVFVSHEGLKKRYGEGK